jgi:hypothetical protein
MSRGGSRSTLTASLRTRNDDALAELLRTRPDLTDPLPADLAALAARATTRSSVLRAIDGLDSAALQVMDALLVAGGRGTAQEIRSLLGWPQSAGNAPDEVTAALGRLEARALAWRIGAPDGRPNDAGPNDAGPNDARYTVVGTMREIAGPYPAGLGPPYDTALANSPGHRTALVAASLGLPDGAKLADVAERIARPAEIERLVGVVSERDPTALQLLTDMTWGPPAGTLPDAMRTIAPADVAGPVELLLALGLLVAVSSQAVVMPREVGLVLRGGRIHDLPRLRAPELELDDRRDEVVSEIAAGAAATLVSQVETLLDTWGTNPPPVLKAGGLSVRDTRATARLLRIEEADVALVVELASVARLLGRDFTKGYDSDELWLPTPGFDSWRDRSAAERWVDLAHAWLRTTRVPALAGERDDRDRRLAILGPDLDRGAAPALRQLVLDILAAVGPSQAASAESVVALANWRSPRRGGAWHELIVRSALRESARLGITGLGALSTFGRALIAEPGGAAQVLGTLLPEPVDHVLLQADLTAVAPGPLRTDVAQELALAADVESTGGATVYRFTPTSIRRALDAGQGAADLHAMLTKRSRTPVPLPLHYLIDDIARKHGRTRVIGAASIVVIDDEGLADQLLNDRSLAALELRRIAPTVLITSRKPDAVIEALRAAGQAPVAENVHGDLVLRRPDVRRAPAPPRWATPKPTPTVDPEALVTTAVRALRAGDRAASARSAVAPDVIIAGPSTSDSLAILRGAIQERRPVWISYLDNNGTRSDRVVEPMQMSGGWLTAYDHLRMSVRTFLVHRIVAIAPVSPDEIDVVWAARPDPFDSAAGAGARGDASEWDDPAWQEADEW